MEAGQARLPPFMRRQGISPEQLAGVFNSLDQETRVGQLLLVHLRWVGKDGSGYQLDESQKKLLRAVQPGGVVLYAQHIGSIAQTMALIDAIKAECRVPPFIAIDEEGGRVSRLSTSRGLFSAKVPAARELAEAGSEAVAKAYRIIGEELWSLGFNMDFAPVADLGFPDSDEVIGDRSFGTDPEMVAYQVSLAVRELQEHGVCSVIKHFPGHGRSTGDSHRGVQSILAAWPLLAEQDLVPFKAAIEAGVGGMMTAHVKYPAVDRSGRPVSMSRILVTDKLRAELGFAGLVITDALDMQGVLASGAEEEIAVQSLQAGVDMLLSPDSPRKVVAAIQAAVAENKLSQARIDESVRRILETKNRFGIFSTPSPWRNEAMAKAIFQLARLRVGQLGASSVDSR